MALGGGTMILEEIGYRVLTITLEGLITQSMRTGHGW